MWAISDRFRAELGKPVHTVAVRIDFLDTDFRVIRSVGAYNGSDPNDSLIDGTVDLDITRGTRRTLTMSLLNPDGIFTPNGSILTSGIDWDGYFYVNRLIRLWRGVRYANGETELVPIGTFMVDKAETLVERGMSTVVIAGSDLWKKLNKSQFGSAGSYAPNQTLNGIIADLAGDAGVTLMNIDPLNGRTSQSYNLQTFFNYEADETRGDKLTKLCNDHGIEVFFDPMGVLTTKDFQDPFSRPTVWSYDENDDMTYFLRSTTNDERLYNHAIVTGTAKATDPTSPAIYVAEMKNTDPSSPTNISRIGDRVFRFESALLGTQEAVDKSVNTIFYKHFLLSNSIDIEAICNPALEGNDVVRVAESRFTKVDERFLLSNISVPLVTSKQKLSMSRVINISPV